jgi:hypothetical protein
MSIAPSEVNLCIVICVEVSKIRKIRKIGNVIERMKEDICASSIHEWISKIPHLSL